MRAGVGKLVLCSHSYLVVARPGAFCIVFSFGSCRVIPHPALERAESVSKGSHVACWSCSGEHELSTLHGGISQTC